MPDPANRPYPHIHRKITDPPPPGKVRLRVRSDGTFVGTQVVTVDHEGVERPLMGVAKIVLKSDPDDRAGLWRAELDVVAPEVKDVIATPEKAT